MSGIARVLAARGASVTGSDLKDSRYLRTLAESGVRVFLGHAASNLGDPRVVVVSSAVPETNPELAEARRRGLPVWPRARMLAHLAGDRQTVAVAGTHGKTTTSSMIAKMLDGAGADPTFLIGGELNDMGANARCGQGRHYVVEADESDGSFMFLDPRVAVVTNVEADHLDHYADLAEVCRTFVAFLSKTSEDGCVVTCADDAGAVRVARACGRRAVTYGTAEDADVRCEGMRREGEGYAFTLRVPGGERTEAVTKVPGMHNVLNATAALATAWVLDVDLSAAAESLAAFTGVRRRFDRLGEAAGVTVVDDYAHHPTEVRATLAAAREGGYRRVVAVFQPHRFSRTAALGREFAEAFEAADRVVLMDVYGAGESPIPGVSGKTVLDAVLGARPRSRVAYLPHRGDVASFVAASVLPGDLVLTMGAGDVTTLGPELLRELGGGEAAAACS
ncbi:MAG: UDP-N-acetylmuramate--L-alanine ligase [Coriobacteriia bacterium]|nr:UDP-N-acetylmuramate--L-alanine ligase [Coriobacteriia bacterium]